jgi:hypothetical protein
MLPHCPSKNNFRSWWPVTQGAVWLDVIIVYQKNKNKRVELHRKRNISLTGLPGFSRYLPCYNCFFPLLGYHS